MTATKKPTPADIVKEMNKAFGEGAVMLGSDPSLVVKYLPTGVLPIDILLLGGLPRGRTTEIYGDYSTLKSFVALRAIATTQANGGMACLVDTEKAYDPEWLTLLGGDPSQLLVLHPDTGEEAIMATEALLRSETCDLIVWDSVAATQTQQQATKKPGEDNQPGSLARMMSRGLNRLNTANKGKTAMLYVNQTRVNLGITYGSMETTPGGKALPFYASYRLRFGKAGKITTDVQVFDTEKMVKTKEAIAHKIKVSLEKSKLNKPHREAWFAFDLKAGQIDDVGFVIAQGLEQNYIRVNNSRYQLVRAGTKPVHGMPKFRASLTEDDVEWLIKMMTPGGYSIPSLTRPSAPVKKRRRKSSVKTV